MINPEDIIVDIDHFQEEGIMTWPVQPKEIIMIFFHDGKSGTKCIVKNLSPFGIKVREFYTNTIHFVFWNSIKYFKYYEQTEDMVSREDPS